MNALTAIILTFNEEIHIERCLRSLKPFVQDVFIVDSYSTDRTVEIAECLGAKVWQHEFINHAKQFQWALDTLPVETEWIMRLDADEYLEPDLQQELPDTLARVSDSTHGFYIRRKVFFYGKWIRYGGVYPQILLRLWRRGKGRIEQRWMDEHIVLPEGVKAETMEGHLVDDNLKGITFWVAKHNIYATREAVDLLNNKYSFLNRDDTLKTMADPQAKWKRYIKDEVYCRLPLVIRPTFYFLYRYVVRLGFLDGTKGFVWHFMQGYWYRMLVDVKIMEIEDRSEGDVERIKSILTQEYGVRM